MKAFTNILAERIVVVMPNWLGDGVMATPLLRALREMYPRARIVALHNGLAGAVVRGLPFVDEGKAYRKGEEREVSAWMRGERFDLAVVLPNSFRSAWMVWRGGVGRRLGYARGGRGWLLTDRVFAKKKSVEQRTADVGKRRAIREIGKEIGGRKTRNLPKAGGYEPVPTIGYYLEMARYLGGDAVLDTGMVLGVTEEERAEGARVLAEAGVDEGERIVVMVPGANFGGSKCWMPERFAQVADVLMDRQGAFKATVVIASSPAEREIVEAIKGASLLAGKGRLVVLAEANGGNGASLGGLKEIVRRSALMVCNDTGPRHFAVAFGVPVVTLFGPTDARWAETFYAGERVARVAVACGPCQLKRCPIDHRCMRGISAQMVLEKVRELWKGAEAGTEAMGGGDYAPGLDDVDVEGL